MQNKHKNHGEWFKSGEVLIKIDSQRDRDQVENFGESIGLRRNGFGYSQILSPYLIVEDNDMINGWNRDVTSYPTLIAFDSLSDFLQAKLPTQSEVVWIMTDRQNNERRTATINNESKLITFEETASGKHVLCLSFWDFYRIADGVNDADSFK